MSTTARRRASHGLSGARRTAGATQRNAATPHAHAQGTQPPGGESTAPAALATNSGQLAPSAPAASGSADPAVVTTGGALGRFLKGFVYAGRGLLYALRTQRNARVHVALAVAAIALGIALRLSAVEFALVIVAITSVFISEMFNTVVEASVDLVSREYHPLARVAKDVAAGAVLLNAILSVVVALFVYVPHLWPLLLRWLGR